MYSVAIISDVHDWHSYQLESILIKKNCKVIKLKYEEIFALFSKERVFHFNKALKDVSGIWVRFIKSGSLEEITTKLTFLHLLEQKGIYIHNSASTIEKTVDKVRTTGLLEINNIRSPKTKVKIGKIKDLENQNDFLLKPIFGSQGKNIILIRNLEDLEKLEAAGNVYYIQKFLGDVKDRRHSDIRVLVSNHEPIAVMKRISKGIITNAYQGALIKKIKMNQVISNLSKKVSKLFNLGYGGIDLKFFENEYYVLEVNSIPSWKSIQKVENKNLSEILVEDFIKNMKKNVC